MRHLLLPLALGLSTLTCTAFAQKMGSSNSNAPKISTTVEFSNGDIIALQYHAVAYGEGKTMKAVQAEGEEGERYRGFVNQRADRNPIGTLTCSADFSFAGKTITAGEYKLKFKIDEKRQWEMIIESKDGEAQHSWPLKTNNSEHSASRMNINLQPGDKESCCGMHIAYGSLRCHPQGKAMNASHKHDGKEHEHGDKDHDGDDDDHGKDHDHKGKGHDKDED